MTSNTSFPLQVITRDEIIFEGEVKAITSQNKVGRFDVLPIHANFISLLDGFVILHKPDGTTQEINLNDGVIRVLEGRAQIFLGIRTMGGGGS